MKNSHFYCVVKARLQFALHKLAGRCCEDLFCLMLSKQTCPGKASFLLYFSQFTSRLAVCFFSQQMSLTLLGVPQLNARRECLRSSLETKMISYIKCTDYETPIKVFEFSPSKLISCSSDLQITTVITIQLL